MARLLGGLTAVAALALGLARLDRLLEPASDSPPWLMVLLTVTLLGVAVTWLSRMMGLFWWVAILINLVGLSLVALRIITPDTLSYGFIPNSESFTAISEQLDFALELIRNGTPPVLAIPGLVAILAVVYWCLGILVAGGIYTDRLWLSYVPPIALYLQLATIHRNLPSSGWVWGLLGVLCLALLTNAANRSVARGKVKYQGERKLRPLVPLLSVLLLASMVTTAWATTRFEQRVPENGVLDWRTGASFGIGRGDGTSFNRFVGLQQTINSLSDRPMFYARLSEGAPPNSRLYWNLITLDIFDGVNWSPSGQSYSRPTRNQEARWEVPSMNFSGPTQTVSARVLVDGLAERLLPSLYSTSALSSEVDLIDQSLRVREDGSLLVDVYSRSGWDYQITANLPQPDYLALASAENQLSPLFQEAARAGVFPDAFSSLPATETPEMVTRYLLLPEDLPGELTTLAQTVTEGASTRFEQALILEAWFRDSDLFTYSTQVSTGHSGLNLVDWLTNPDSINYRTGYCEQYATSLAVLARTLGIPSRVALGFAPGQIITLTDGSPAILVRERHAHSWVELWMDGQGWIRFDPTPRSDQINPSTTGSELGFDPRLFIPPPAEPEGGSSAFGGRQDPLLPEIDTAFGDPTPDLRLLLGEEGGFPWWVLVPTGAGLIILGTPFYKVIRWRRRKTRIGQGEMVPGWEEIIDRLRGLGFRLSSSLSPLEIANSFSPELSPLAHSYSAAIYGSGYQENRLSQQLFDQAEQSLRHRYSWLRRWWSWMRPRSLRPLR